MRLLVALVVFHPNIRRSRRASELVEDFIEPSLDYNSKR